MKPKNLVNIMMGQYYSTPDWIRNGVGRTEADEAFFQNIPRDEMTPNWITKFYWPHRNPAYRSLTTDTDIHFLKTMLLSDSTVQFQDTRHVLPISFFEASDFDHENHVIRIPAERMVQQVKNVLFTEDTQFIFIESREPGRMIPFMYDSSIESNANLDTNECMFKHKFRPATQHVGWRLEIVHPIGWSWIKPTGINAPIYTATPIVSNNGTIMMAQTKFQRIPKTSPYFDMNAINQIFDEIKGTGSYNESDYNGRF